MGWAWWWPGFERRPPSWARHEGDPTADEVRRFTRPYDVDRAIAEGDLLLITWPDAARAEKGAKP